MKLSFGEWIILSDVDKVCLNDGCCAFAVNIYDMSNNIQNIKIKFN